MYINSVKKDKQANDIVNFKKMKFCHKNKNYIGKLTFAHQSGGIVTKETGVNFRDDYFFKLKSVPNNKMIQDIANDLFGGKRRRKTNRRNTNRRKTKRRK